MPKAEKTQPQETNPTDRFFSMFYKDLRGMARRYLSHERVGHTLQPTALVNEVFLKLSRQRLGDFQSKSHFMAVGAMMMRRILVDHARRSLSMKRKALSAIGTERNKPLAGLSAEELIDLDHALGRLAQLDPRQAQMVELRFFAGLSVQELADTLKLSVRTVEYDLQMAKAWLLRDMQR